MRRVLRCVAATAAWVVLAATDRAAAQGLAGRLELRWRAPVDCPTAADVERRVDELLGHPRTALTELDVLHADATIARVPGGRWRMQLHTARRAAPRRQTLEGGSCRALGDAAALILAVIIDPAAAARASAMSASPPAETSSPAGADASGDAPAVDTRQDSVVPATRIEPVNPAGASAPARAPATRAPDQTPRPIAPGAGPRGAAPRRTQTGALRPRARPAWLVRAAALVDLGALPRVAPGASVAVGGSVGPLRVEIGAVYLPPQRSTPDAAQRGGTFDLLAGVMRACLDLARPRWALGGCFVGEAGVLRGIGYGATENRQGLGTWLAPGAAVDARWNLWRWIGIFAETGVLVPLVRPPYVLTGAATVHRSWPISVRASLGIEMHF